MSTIETAVKKNYAKLYLMGDLNDTHVVVDCCPRKGDLTSPSQDQSVTRVYDLNENIFNVNRQRYTFYLNYFMVEGLVRDGGELSITCPCCRKTGILQERHLDSLLDERGDEEKVLEMAA